MKRLTRVCKVSILLIVFLVFSPVKSFCAQATGNGGTIQGTVTDPSGAPVAGADVTITNSVSAYTQSVKSGQDGGFRLVNLPPNQYRLQVTFPGFQPYSQDVPVHTQVPIQVKAALTIAGSTETVNVSASAEVLENVPASHTDVSQTLLENLPVSTVGQGLSDAITLTSGGVVADSNGFFHPQGDHGETTYVVDGQSISDQQSKTFSTQLPSNAFQSLELVTAGPSAEFGDKTSMIVNAVTRSGLGQKPTGSLDLSYGSFGTLNERRRLESAALSGAISWWSIRTVAAAFLIPLNLRRFMTSVITKPSSTASTSNLAATIRSTWIYSALGIGSKFPILTINSLRTSVSKLPP